MSLQPPARTNICTPRALTKEHMQACKSTMYAGTAATRHIPVDPCHVLVASRHVPVTLVSRPCESRTICTTGTRPTPQPDTTPFLHICHAERTCHNRPHVHVLVVLPAPRLQQGDLPHFDSPEHAKGFSGCGDLPCQSRARVSTRLRAVCRNHHPAARTHLHRKVLWPCQQLQN